MEAGCSNALILTDKPSNNLSMENGKKEIVNLYHDLIPQEEIVEPKRKKKSFSIGIPRETSFQENRIALVPDAVGMLCQNGHTVFVENEAGKSSRFSNSEFSEAGAIIKYTPEEIYQSDIIIKVAPPALYEIDMMQKGQTLFSIMDMMNQSAEYYRKLSRKKITAIAFELMKDRSGIFPVKKAMSEIAGNTSIIIAAEYLSHSKFGKGYMLGGFSGITPTEIVIIGAGTVAEFAARSAIGFGAMVKIFDNNLYKLRSIQEKLNTRVFTSIIQPRVLLKSLKTADVLIGALHSNEGRTQCVVTEDMVSQMKKGSVIIDVCIDQGGCVETSKITNHANPVFQKYEVTHYCVPNIASRVPCTASYALSNFLAPILLQIADDGGIQEALSIKQWLRYGVYLLNGILTNKIVGDYFKLPYQDINLLFNAFDL